MSEIKTKATNQNVPEFLNKIEPEEKRKDGFEILAMMQKITGEKAILWGTSIIGFGSYHYKSDRSKQEGDWPLIGFSPRKQNLTLYIMNGFKDSQALLKKLGKHKISSGSCLYINQLADVDIKILAKVIDTSFRYMKEKNKS